MTIQAPYRFVPLSNLVVLPDWASKVSHDKPFKDGICGELEISITTHGEMCLGGEQVAATIQEAGQVRFYRTPDDKVAIPGSSLKGMVRNVLEIATFSRFKQVQDQKLGVRDISEANNFYAKEIVSKPVSSGWLKFEKGEWVIYPCRFARVHQKEIIENFNIRYDDWIKIKSAKQRYDLLGVCPPIQFNEGARNKNGQLTANIVVGATLSGHLVVTGQPGSFYQKNDISKPTAAKKSEFIFYENEAASLKVTAKTMSEFRQIHEETVEWKYWLSKLSNLSRGIPVFFHREKDQIESLGLAMMYKLAYKNSIHDAINHTSDLHVNHSSPDFADLIFGYLGEDGSQGLKGRVNIGQGTLQSAVIMSWTRLTVLSAPKPTYYPAYIRQNKSDGFNQLMQKNVELSGWKRYPIKPVHILPPPDKSQSKVQVKLETVAKGTVFSSKIRIHNLRPVELGALLWSIDFGGNRSLRHGLGIGKPYGLGQVGLSIEDAILRRNDRVQIVDNQDFLLACRLEFEAYMNQVMRTANLNTTWQKTGEIQALLEYAKEDIHANDLDYLPTPKAFADLRKRENIHEFRNVFHQRESVKVDRLFDSKSVSYQNHLEDQIIHAKQQAQALTDKQERDAKKQNATEEDRIIIELEEFIASAKREVTKTIKSKANKLFKEPFESHWVYFTGEQRVQFRQLANQAAELIQDNSLTKTVKRINTTE